MAQRCELANAKILCMVDSQQEVEELHETPTVSRPASPTPTGPTALHKAKTGSFNFLGSRNTPSLNALMFSLPNPDEAEVLIDSYYRYFGWS